MSDEAFTQYVNTELPKRIATNESPLDVPPGMVFVTLGAGLLTELKPYISDEPSDERTKWEIVEW